MNKSTDLWEKRKEDLACSIEAALERGKVDKEVLEVMKELLKGIKVTSMEDYFEDIT